MTKMNTLEAGLKARSARVSLFSAVCSAKRCDLNWCKYKYDPLLQRNQPNYPAVVLRRRVGPVDRRRGAGRERQRLDERSATRRRSFHSGGRQQQHPGLQGAARHSEPVARDRRRLGDGGAFGHAARLRRRGPLPDRDGRRHPEWSAHWRRIDRRGGHGDSRGHGNRARLAGDGSSRKGAQEAGGRRPGDDPALRAQLFGLQGRLSGGEEKIVSSFKFQVSSFKFRVSSFRPIGGSSSRNRTALTAKGAAAVVARDFPRPTRNWKLETRNCSL